MTASGVAEVASVQQQTVKVAGVVTDQNGDPLIGVNVVEVGTNNGVITDADGRFTLSVRPNARLQVSYIGYLTQTVSVGGQSALSITLKEDSKALDEVVVTAFGIKREEKALGYAVQKVSGDKLSTVKTVDLGTSLTGKVAGMNVKNSTEFNVAPTLEIRGETPLIVVDGVPYGNITLRDIASDDVESIDVLKGATASALYGARGGSGVIMITTKKGNKEGLDVTVNSSTMFNAGYLALPEAQHSYSSGSGGKYNRNDDVWGDRLDVGRTAVQYNPFTYTWEEAPLTSKGKDNFKNFLRQGFSTNNNVSVGWRGKNGGFRTSLNHVYNHGQYPNQNMQKMIYSLSGNLKTGNFSLEGGATWNKRFHSNDRGTGYGGGGYIYNILVWTGSNYDLRDYRDYWVKGYEGERQNWLYGSWYDNPYFMANEIIRANDYDKLNTYAYGKYDILPWLNFSTRIGVDFFASRTEERNPIGTRANTLVIKQQGRYASTKETGFSLNSDFILAASHSFGDLSVDALAGSTIYYMYEDLLMAETTNGLTVPGYYSLKASKGPISAKDTYKSKRVNSLYGKLSLAWKSLAYLDITGRNDWSSTLPSSTRSYFYPSVSGSVIMSEFIKLPAPFTFWKLRGSWTVTKTDLTIFEIQQAYTVNTGVWNKLNTATYPTTLRGSDLKPVTSRTYEVGTAFNLWENRLRFDVAYYNKLVYNRVTSASVSDASGFSTSLINFGEDLERRGVEVTLGADLIKSKDWEWTMNLNWAMDRYRFASIDSVYSAKNSWTQKGMRSDFISTDQSDVSNDWQRDANGNLILQNGLPVRNTYETLVGYINPDWIWGVSSALRYKNWTLNLSVDGRVGGLAYNKTEQALWNTGAHPDSDTPERYEEVMNGNITFIAPGVKVVSGEVKYDVDGTVLSDTRQFAPNDVAVSYQSFITKYHSNSYWGEPHNYKNTTFLKLRELSLTYDFPQRICERVRLKGASLSFIGQNLLMWTKDFRFADPDVHADDLSSPSQRFLGFNFKFNF